MPSAYVIEVIAIVLAIYTLAYLYYGRRILQEKIVRARADSPTPAIEKFDGIDYVPANKYVLFGHHFASIAGAGPIVGPAIAMAYGWLLPLIWVLFGNVFIGTVHDYLALMASVRHGGISIMSVSEIVMGRNARYVFLAYTFMALLLVYAAFASVAARQFTKSPSAATLSILYMPIALFMGIMMYRIGLDTRIATLITMLLVIGAFYYSYYTPFHLGPTEDWKAYHNWVIVLGVYAILAASLPVWYLLQPRDYTNSYILFTFVGFAVLGGILVADKVLVGPAYTSFAPKIAGFANQPTPFWPAIPLIIACGSLSGFHSLVSSGTTSKQLASELEGLFIGYGAMLTEGALSTLAVIIPISLAWDVPVLKEMGMYKENILEQGAVGRFAVGYGYMLASGLSRLGLDFASAFSLFKLFATISLILFVMTTLDTATRLARFAFQELMDWTQNISKSLYAIISNKWIASFIVVLIGSAMAYPTVQIGEKQVAAYNVVWPAFAGVNQMLAALALLTSALWVYAVVRVRGVYSSLIMIPALFLWVTVTVGLAWWLVVVAPKLPAIQSIGAGGISAISLLLNIGLLFLFVKGLSRAKSM